MIIVNCYYVEETNHTYTELKKHKKVWHWMAKEWIKYLKKDQLAMQKWIIENNVIEFKALEFIE